MDPLAFRVFPKVVSAEPSMMPIMGIGTRELGNKLDLIC